MAKEHKTTIGGQALLEGIMMRGPERTAAVVRTAAGFEIKEEPTPQPRYKFLKYPFIRGIPGFVGSMATGIRLLTWSSEFYEEDEETKAKYAEKQRKKEEKTGVKAPAEEKPTSAESKLMAVFAALLAGIIAIGLFTVLPTFLGGLAEPYIGSGFLRNLMETLLRLFVLFLYMLLVSRLKDIQRTFSYHGAEHKAIACYEAGDELTLENVRRHTRFHPRCGTSFLLTVVIISMLVFLLVSSLLSYLHWDNNLLRIAFRLALLPFVVSISYEFNRLVGRYDNRFTAILRGPGMAMQRLTTNEPDDDMLTVGIKALELVLPRKEGDDRW